MTKLNKLRLAIGVTNAEISKSVKYTEVYVHMIVTGKANNKAAKNKIENYLKKKLAKKRLELYKIEKSFVKYKKRVTYF